MLSVMTDPAEELFTPAQKREIIKLVTETMIAFEGEAMNPITWLHIMEAITNAGKRPKPVEPCKIQKQ